MIIIVMMMMMINGDDDDHYDMIVIMSMMIKMIIINHDRVANNHDRAVSPLAPGLYTFNAIPLLIWW